MGKKLRMVQTGEFILWAVIPQTATQPFNRAYGPFESRSAAYSAKKSLVRMKRDTMHDEGYPVEEIERTISAIKWSTTGLWSKIDREKLVSSPARVAPDTPQERAAAALWNRARPVVRGTRPPWDSVRDDPAWKSAVKKRRRDAIAVLAAIGDVETN